MEQEELELLIIDKDIGTLANSYSKMELAQICFLALEVIREKNKLLELKNGKR